MLRKKNKFRNDPRRRSGVSKRDPGESCDSPKLFWVRGSEAVRGLLTCWAQSPGSGQNQVETKLLLRQQYAMPQVAHNSWRKKMEESKMTRRFGALNAKDHIPVTLWPGLGYSLWIPELTIFPFWATEWKYYLTGQFWLESKTLPKVEEWYRWLEFRCSGQKFPLYHLWTPDLWWGWARCGFGRQISTTHRWSDFAPRRASPPRGPGPRGPGGGSRSVHLWVSTAGIPWPWPSTAKSARRWRLAEFCKQERWKRRVPFRQTHLRIRPTN